MLFDFAVQFMIELIRAFLVDELSRRVRALPRKHRPLDATLARIHRRNRDRLLNKLLTESTPDL